MTKKFAIIGSGVSIAALHLLRLKELYGTDIDVVTSEEVQERGINIHAIRKIPPLPNIECIEPIAKSGKEKRRERRKKERKK